MSTVFLEDDPFVQDSYWGFWLGGFPLILNIDGTRCMIYGETKENLAILSFDEESEAVVELKEFTCAEVQAFMGSAPINRVILLKKDGTNIQLEIQGYLGLDNIAEA